MISRQSERRLVKKEKDLHTMKGWLHKLQHHHSVTVCIVRSAWKGSWKVVLGSLIYHEYQNIIENTLNTYIVLFILYKSLTILQGPVYIGIISVVLDM